MKKQMSLFVWAVAVFGMAPVWADTNTGMRGATTADMTGGPAVRTRQGVDYKKYQTRTSVKTYESKDAKNLYYSTPSKRSDLYKQFDANRGTTTTTRTSRIEIARQKAQRKYYLAHPFFQPTKGKFGSVTDLNYVMNSYDFDTTLNLVDATLAGPGGKWEMGQFNVKEDFSYGITDQIAVIAMAKFDSSTYKFKWDKAQDPNATDDKMDDSGVNLYGAGVQWRFLDNDKWIATVSGQYQHQNDFSNNGLLDLRAGYKYKQSTFYGLGRLWYVDFDGNSYGNGTTDGDKAVFLAYKTNTDNAFYVEGGAGVFSVLDPDWTLNAEAVFGHYDWHQQLSIKGAIGWQPNEWVALNLYLKTLLYDSADDKNLELYWREPAIGYNDYTRVGTASLDKYRETSFGLQAIFYF